MLAELSVACRHLPLVLTGWLLRDLRQGEFWNPMDLMDFPFDVDDLDLRFETTSNWETLDGCRSGNLPGKRSYRLRPVQPDRKEGHWLMLGADWSPISEWRLHGVSTELNELPPDPQGREWTTLNLRFHASRRSGFYIYKTMVPLWATWVLGMTTFWLETDDLASRLSMSITGLLAGFALLFVVADALPKTDFLTAVDVVIMIATVSLGLSGVASCVLSSMHKHKGEELAAWWNHTCIIGLSAVFVLGNLACFLPSMQRKRKQVKMLEGGATNDDTQVHTGMISIQRTLQYPRGSTSTQQFAEYTEAMTNPASVGDKPGNVYAHMDDIGRYGSSK